jgi:hypothetical protein
MTVEPMLTAAKRWRDRAEAIAGAFAVFFIGFAPPVLALLMGLAALTNAENAKDLPAWVCFPVALISGAFALGLARLIQRTLYMCHPELKKLDRAMLRGQKPLITPFDSDQPLEKTDLPMAIVAGMNLPRIPIALAVPLAMWWLAHGGAGIFIGLRLDQYIDSAVHDAPAAVKYVLPNVLNFGLSFAANIYLMLAVALFVRKTTVLLWLWKVRLLIDLVLTAITAVPALIEWIGKLA